MKLATGNMWLTPCDMLLVTTNAFLRSDGTLVMGRGAAKEACLRVPGFDKTCGDAIKHYSRQCYAGKYDPTFPYGVLITGTTAVTGRVLLDVKRAVMGIFQVKYHWSNLADLDLIRLSVAELEQIAAQRKGESISLNFPGIGNGGLRRADVLPLLQSLPDNVTVWKLQ